MTVYYEAFDGTKFTDEDECLDYERVATLKEEIADGSTVILDDDFEVLDKNSFKYSSFRRNFFCRNWFCSWRFILLL